MIKHCIHWGRKSLFKVTHNSIVKRKQPYVSMQNSNNYRYYCGYYWNHPNYKRCHTKFHSFSSTSSATTSAATTTTTKRLHSSQFSSIQEEINDANQRYKNQLIIKSTNNLGYGIYATKQYNPNDIVFQIRAVEKTPKRDSHSVQLDWNVHAIIDLPGRFINHSCDANCGILQQQQQLDDSNDCDDVAYNIIALKSIRQGEELFVDYETFEYEISAFEECICGVPSCRKVLGGFQKHGKELREKYGDFVADYLKDAT